MESYPLLYRLGTATNVFSMEAIENSWLWRWQEGCTSQNYMYLLFKLRALAPLQIPTFLYEGPIHLLLCYYTFIVESPPSHLSTIGEHYCHSYALSVVSVECDMTGSFVPRITMFSRCLNFRGTLHLCFAVSEMTSKIPLLPYYIMIVFTKCWHLRYVIVTR